MCASVWLRVPHKTASGFSLQPWAGGGDGDAACVKGPRHAQPR